MNKRIALLLIVALGFLGANPPKKTGVNIALSPPLFFGIKTVVIDAGHGGKDPGCLGITTSKEKDVALAIALRLGKYIQEKTPDVRVVYTRSTDIFLTLEERAAIANNNKADLFICIHCNTACSINKKTKKKSCNEEVFGTETYVMGLHKTNANLNVAKRENESILLEKDYKKRYDGFNPNSEEGYILLTLQQNAYLKQSTNFASKVQKHVKEKAGRADKSVQQAGFLVLWRTAMPSVLIETEFLSNTESERFMVSQNGQDKLAWSIFSAFRQYKDEVEGKYARYDDDPEIKTPLTPKKDTAAVKDKAQGSNNPEKLKKDSVAINKEPIIENETKAEIAPKDSLLLKNEMLPPVKKDTIKLIASIDTTKTINPVIPPIPKENIVYKVQFMASGQRIPLLSDKFKGLKDLGEYEDNGSFKYTAGEFKTVEEGLKYRKEMQAKGYKDCFVVKFKDGKRMKNDR